MQQQQQQPCHQPGDPRPLMVLLGQTKPCHFATGKSLSTCLWSTVLLAGGAARSVAWLLLQLHAAVCCQTVKKKTVKFTPCLIPHMSHRAQEPWVNMWQRRYGSSAFYSQGKTIPTGSWTGSPSGDQLLQHTLYKLRQAAAGSLGRCSAGLHKQEPAWSSRHKLFLMSKLLLMTQLTNWGLLRSS